MAILPTHPKIWIISNQATGDDNARRGVAMELGDASPFELKVNDEEIDYVNLAKVLQDNHLPSNPKEIDFPDVIIGRFHDVAIMRDLKRLSGSKTKIVTMPSPIYDLAPMGVIDRVSIKNKWDVSDVVIGFDHQHIDIPGADMSKLIRVPTVPNLITPENLENGTNGWGQQFSELSKGRTTFALLVGGDVAMDDEIYPLTSEHAKELAEQVNAIVSRHNGALLVTNSRRTEEEASRELAKHITVTPAYIHDCHKDKEHNPYFGIMAKADALIVTGDSMSMLSEAVDSGKPVYIATGNRQLPEMHQRFIQALYDRGLAHPLEILETHALVSAPSVIGRPGAEMGQAIRSMIENADMQRSR